jgi:hypothetical protein
MTVGFVQFHPSYDYVDFVEGLRPDRNGDNVIFKREDGIFKKFCKQAIENSKTPVAGAVDNFDDAWNNLCITLNGEKDNVLKFMLSNGDYRYYQLSESNQYFSQVEMIDGRYVLKRQTRLYKSQFYKLYKHGKSNKVGAYDFYRNFFIQYMKEHCGLKEYQSGDTTNSKPINYVFIIDEINRGDLSKIFGELFFAIDPGYRGEKGRVKTQYQQLVDAEEDDVFSGEGFYVPDNVYIIGTMNDIDRSVESMDFALRRRFAWQKIKPEDTAESMKLSDDVIERMKRVNDAICGINELGEDYQIGGAYFLKMLDENEKKDIAWKDVWNSKNDEEKDKLWDELWQFHLESLIGEYLRGLPNKDELYNKIKDAYDNPRKANGETKPQADSAED